MLLRHIGCALTLVVSITACAPDPSPGSAVPISTLGQPADKCPSSEFAEFLKRFTNDSRIQQAFVRYPYTIARYDPQNLESDPSLETHQRGELEFPIMPTSGEMRMQGINTKVEKIKPDFYRVFIYQPGSDAFSSSFDFQKQTGCWYLIHSTE